MLSAFWRFTRPHTFIATAIQVVSLYFIAGGRQPLDSATLLRILATLATCLALNLCIVGLNQLTDVGIDRINKPRLPLASGDMSPATGKLLVILAGITNLLGGWSADGYLGTTVTVILVIGVLYSLPPFRFKRLPLPAALGIAVSRGVVANLGVALHFHHGMVHGTPFPLGTVLLVSAFFFCFCLVIAVYKDIPDQPGDRLHGIRTYSLDWGPRRVFDTGRVILAAGYGALMAAALLNLDHPEGQVLLLAQVLALYVFLRASRRIDPCDARVFPRFYMLLWGLFYSQYVVLGAWQFSRGGV